MLINATDDFLKAEAERRHRKELQRAAEDRLLDPWERYRAVSDHCDRLMDLTELYDRKTRFALVILGTLNRRIADTSFEVARLNEAKRRSLDRVFAGLTILAAMTATMIVGVALAGSAHLTRAI